MAEAPTISQEKIVESKEWWLGTDTAASCEHEGGFDKRARMKTVMKDALVGGVPVTIGHEFVESSIFSQSQNLCRLRVILKSLWCQGYDDLFKARVTAQRVPERIETDLAVGDACGKFCECSQLLDGLVALFCPCTDNRIK